LKCAAPFAAQGENSKARFLLYCAAHDQPLVAGVIGHKAKPAKPDAENTRGELKIDHHMLGLDEVRFGSWKFPFDAGYTDPSDVACANSASAMTTGSRDVTGTK
jgi:hypothetical protein